MKLSTFIALAAASASTTLAVPVQADANGVANMMVKSCTWTIQNFERECYMEDTACWISFDVNENNGSNATHCSYQSNGSHAPYAQVACGDYMIGSTWSGQFGPGEGFTTLSVVKEGMIIWPAYKDTQLVDWVPVKPDQSYTPQRLP